MLEIKNLHASVDGKEILKGLNLTMGAGEVHAIMGPNGSGKSTLSYVLSGRDGYEVTDGSASYNGKDLLAMVPEERAGEGVFLAFQYPMEIPGVATMEFLKVAMNSQRKARGQVGKVVKSKIKESDKKKAKATMQKAQVAAKAHLAMKKAKQEKVLG